MSATKFHFVVDGLTRLCGIDPSVGAGIFEADFRKAAAAGKRSALCQDCLDKMDAAQPAEEPEEEDEKPAPRSKAHVSKKAKPKSRGK